ncbi:MAG TPA: hypothetical protein VK803_12875 [Steroidobacteraceae bacterium]|jgi:hypothetical protein|nr:hypothetical protein [Steroidobacteraceae bacterium]
MRTATIMMGAALAALSCGLAQAQQSPPPASPPTPAVSAESAPPAAAAPAAAFTVDPRLVFSGDGMTLTGNHGGGGGAATFLGNYGPGDVLGLGVEYQAIANTHWTDGTFNGSLGLGSGNVRTSLYVEAHEGAGDIAQTAFHYSVLAAGWVTTFNSYASVQLEERRIDVDSSHGNLPKIGLSLRVLPQLLASLSYAESFGGNLGTKLGTVRLDYSSKAVNWLAGIAYGPAAPSVLNLFGQELRAAPILREGFAGVGKTFGRTDWQLLGDYQNLDGFKRTTLTLNCTLHLAAAGHT